MKILQGYSKEDEHSDETVIAPEEMRLERIMVRDGIKKEAALRRIRAQKDESFYKTHADIIIKNYPPYNLDDEVKKVLLWAKL